MVLGWDIGGVNTKVARLEGDVVAAVRMRPFELQRAPQALVPLLRQLADEVGGGSAVHAVTMTAELSQMFRTKREGVGFVLDAVAAAFPGADVRVFAVDGALLSVDEARARPLAVAAANWSATAHAVARLRSDALLVDIGTTTTDLVPIVEGQVAATGWTDPGRLASGELVYTGAVRTPVEAIVARVPLGTVRVGVSAEGFALAGDVHLWRGALAESDYTAPTPDGRPSTRAWAGERIARVVCGDREMLSDEDISVIAAAVAGAQVDAVTRAMRRVAARHPSIRTAVVTGLGAFIGEAAAQAAGLDVVHLAETFGDAAARCAPAAAVAMLCRQGVGTRAARVAQAVRHAIHFVDAVVKVGGGLLSHDPHLDRVLDTIAAAARERRTLIVPGGGPFADAVRAAEQKTPLSDDAAHWMAVLAMDQYAHLLADRLKHAVIVTDRDGIGDALDGGRVPVLAPFQWLRDCDPLPHSWEVTSDSIAAWFAGELGAPLLVLIKPPGASGGDLVDAYFPRALPARVGLEIVSAERVDQVAEALAGGRAGV